MLLTKPTNYWHRLFQYTLEPTHKLLNSKLQCHFYDCNYYLKFAHLLSHRVMFLGVRRDKQIFAFVRINFWMCLGCFLGLFSIFFFGGEMLVGLLFCLINFCYYLAQKEISSWPLFWYFGLLRSRKWKLHR